MEKIVKRKQGVRLQGIARFPSQGSAVYQGFELSALFFVCWLTFIEATNCLQNFIGEVIHKSRKNFP